MGATDGQQPDEAAEDGELVTVKWLLLLLGVLFGLVASWQAEPAVSVESYCVGGCPIDDYTVTGFRQTEALVMFAYYTQGAPFGSQLAAVQSGIEQWGTATTSATNTGMVVDATSPAKHLCGGGNGAPFPQGLNGKNDIIWAPLDGMAIGRACWSGQDEADIVLDSGWAGFVNEGATMTVVAHEVGHAVGIGHSTVVGTVMYPSYSSPKPLQPDDVAGFCAIYGCGVETPTATPTATPTLTPTPTPTVVLSRCGTRLWVGTAVCKFAPQVVK